MSLADKLKGFWKFTRYQTLVGASAGLLALGCSQGGTTDAFSANARMIAFTSDRDGNNEIYIMNADGSEQKRITDEITEFWGVSWSPDGQKIAFGTNKDYNNEIYIMNADGSEQKNLTNNPAVDLSPAWSP